jgi:hypothetical protein
MGSITLLAAGESLSITNKRKNNEEWKQIITHKKKISIWPGLGDSQVR